MSVSDAASRKRAADLVKSGTELIANAGVPGAGLLVRTVWSLMAEHRNKRIDEVIDFAFGADEPAADEDEKAEKVRGWLQDSPFCIETMNAVVVDDERSKSWIYAALLHAFGTGAIPPAVRPMMLRIVRSSYDDELRFFAAMGTAYGQMRAASLDAAEALRLLGPGFEDVDPIAATSAASNMARTLVARLGSEHRSIAVALKDNGFRDSEDMFNERFQGCWYPVLRRASASIGLSKIVSGIDPIAQFRMTSRWTR